MPRVSVIIRAFIAGALRSVEAQTFRDWELSAESASNPRRGVPPAPAAREVSADTLVVSVTLRSQVDDHAASIARPSAPQIVHYMPEQHSARRLAAKLVLRRYGAV